MAAARAEKMVAKDEEYGKIKNDMKKIVLDGKSFV